MLWAYNSATQVFTASGTIGFDTVICSTNGNAQLANGKIVQISQPGWYDVTLQAVLSNGSTATTAGVSLFEGSSAVNGASASVSIAASSSVPVVLSYPVHVVSAQSGIASVSFCVNSAVTVDSAILSVQRKA